MCLDTEARLAVCTVVIARLFASLALGLRGTRQCLLFSSRKIFSLHQSHASFKGGRETSLPERYCAVQFLPLVQESVHSREGRSSSDELHPARGRECVCMLRSISVLVFCLAFCFFFTPVSSTMMNGEVRPSPFFQSVFSYDSSRLHCFCFFSLSFDRWKDSASVAESHAVRPADEARVRILRKKDTYGHVCTPHVSQSPLSPRVYTYIHIYMYVPIETYV